MKEDNISQLGDYDAPFCEQQHRHGSCYISLFKFRSFDQLITPPPPPPKAASNFRHLLSCGTIDTVLFKLACSMKLLGLLPDGAQVVRDA